MAWPNAQASTGSNCPVRDLGSLWRLASSQATTTTFSRSSVASKTVSPRVSRSAVSSSCAARRKSKSLQTSCASSSRRNPSLKVLLYGSCRSSPSRVNVDRVRCNDARGNPATRSSSVKVMGARLADTTFSKPMAFSSTPMPAGTASVGDCAVAAIAERAATRRRGASCGGVLFIAAKLHPDQRTTRTRENPDGWNKYG